MRTTVTVARNHDTQQWDVLFGPNVSMLVQRRRLKELRIRGSDDKIAEVWLLEPIRKTRLKRSYAATVAAPPPPTAKAAVEAVKRAGASLASRLRGAKAKGKAG